MCQHEDEKKSLPLSCGTRRRFALSLHAYAQAPVCATDSGPDAPLAIAPASRGAVARTPPPPGPPLRAARHELGQLDARFHDARGQGGADDHALLFVHINRRVGHCGDPGGRLHLPRKQQPLRRHPCRDQPPAVGHQRPADLLDRLRGGLGRAPDRWHQVPHEHGNWQRPGRPPSPSRRGGSRRANAAPWECRSASARAWM